MAKNWIPLRQVEGTASRQAHVRLPEGTYEVRTYLLREGRIVAAA